MKNGIRNMGIKLIIFDFITPMPFPQVKETLEVLRNRGISLAIASSRTSESLRDLLDRMGMESLFSCVIGAQDMALGSAALHRKELKEAGADFIIDRMEELIEKVDKI